MCPSGPFFCSQMLRAPREGGAAIVYLFMINRVAVCRSTLTPADKADYRPANFRKMNGNRDGTVIREVLLLTFLC